MTIQTLAFSYDFDMATYGAAPPETQERILEETYRNIAQELATRLLDSGLVHFFLDRRASMPVVAMRGELRAEVPRHGEFTLPRRDDITRFVGLDGVATMPEAAFPWDARRYYLAYPATRAAVDASTIDGDVSATEVGIRDNQTGRPVNAAALSDEEINHLAATLPTQPPSPTRPGRGGRS